MEFLPTRQRPAPEPESASRQLLLRRALATGVDAAVCYAVGVAPIIYLALLASTAFGRLGQGAIAISLGLLIPVYLTYCFAFEWLYGRTPGKTMLGLIVVTEGGDHIGFKQSAIRNILRYIDILGLPPAVYVVGLVSALVSPTAQRIGDRLADTVVARSSGRR